MNLINLLEDIDTSEEESHWDWEPDEVPVDDLIRILVTSEK